MRAPAITIAAAVIALNPLPRASASTQALLLIGSLDAQATPEREGLFAQINTRISNGVTTALDGGNDRYARFVSVEQLTKENNTLGKDLVGYRDYVGSDGNLRISDLHNLPKIKGRAPAGYLLVSFSQSGADPQIDLRLYERGSTGAWTKRSHKTVGGPGAVLEDVLDALEDAARWAVTSESGTVPGAHIEPLAHQVVARTSKVILDGSGSVDLDHDALVWLWCQDPPAGTEKRWMIPETGSMGRRLQLLATTVGEYAFTLHVQEAILPEGKRRISCRSSTADPTSAAGSDREEKDPSVDRVHFRVVDAPRVHAGDARQLEVAFGQQPPQHLEGKCESCVEFRWRQLSGPHVEVSTEERTARDCSATWQRISDDHPGAACQFVPGPPGEYAFELIGRNDLGEARHQVRFLVAPKPVVMTGSRVRALVGRPMELNGTASFDFVDANPQFRWEARRLPFAKDGCVPSGDYADEAQVLAPRGATATFLATRDGTYYVRLMVIANRTFDGQAMASYDCKTMQIEVVPRRWSAWLAGGGHPSLSNSGSLSEAFDLQLGGNKYFGSSHWGIRASQVLYTYSFERDDDGHVFGGGLLGGSTLGLSYTIDRLQFAWLRLWGGGYLRIINGRRAGPSGGFDVLVPVLENWGLGQNWVISASVDLHWLTVLEAPYPHDWDLRVAFGAGYTF
jgi:hypothetical protein